MMNWIGCVFSWESRLQFYNKSLTTISFNFTGRFLQYYVFFIFKSNKIIQISVCQTYVKENLNEKLIVKLRPVWEWVAILRLYEDLDAWCLREWKYFSGFYVDSC